MPDTITAPIKSEASPSLTPQPAQLEKAAVSTAIQSSKQDSVTLSSTARDMSKALNQQHDHETEIKKEAVKQQEKSVTAESKSYSAAGKSYPPFMGNGEELKILKESSPSLYREILRMIVPPPLNISPVDLQMLQGAQASRSIIKSEPTTA
jgi:glycosidase